MPGHTLAQMVRAKHPGAYDDMDDAALEASVRAKFPGVYDDIPSTEAAAPAPERPKSMYEKGATIESMLANAEQRSAELRGEALEHPIRTAAMVAAPGILSVAGKVGPPVVQAAARATGATLNNPLVGAGIGAYQGYQYGGPLGALGGAAVGASSQNRIARVLERRFPALKRPTRTGQPSPTPDTPPPANTPAEAMQREVSARDINWRTTDAVPVDAIKRDITRGGSIIEAGESQLGLMDRIAAALKTQRGKPPTKEQLDEALRLASAYRQRQHITAKTAARR